MSDTENTSLVADKNAEEAIHEIALIDDAEVLQSIIDADTRKTVREAAEKRLAKLGEGGGGTAVYQVEIPDCLLGKRYVLASSESEAADKYKRPCGITQHLQPIQVSATPLDPNDLPEGITLYGEPEPAPADQ